MILVIDNYDSFTWNLVDYLRQLGATVRVERNDALSVPQAMAGGAAILLSPGPGTPEQAGITLPLVAACAEAKRPLLGVCLGHQAIGRHFGGAVVRGGLMHGKAADVIHDGSGLFAGLPSPCEVVRYHSLIVADAPPPLIANARSADGLVMGLRHPDLPIHGVQFHPESIGTAHGHALLANFLHVARAAMAAR
jgi:anthranilate synthase component 2